MTHRLEMKDLDLYRQAFIVECLGLFLFMILQGLMLFSGKQDSDM